jgi:hypothetical protein
VIFNFLILNSDICFSLLIFKVTIFLNIAVQKYYLFFEKKLRNKNDILIKKRLKSSYTKNLTIQRPVHIFHIQNTLVACRSFLQRYSFLLTITRKYNFNNLSNSLRNNCCRKQLDFIRFFIKPSQLLFIKHFYFFITFQKTNNIFIQQCLEK